MLMTTGRVREVQERISKYLADHQDTLGPFTVAAGDSQTGWIRVQVEVPSYAWDVVDVVVSAVDETERDLGLVVDLDIQASEV